VVTVAQSPILCPTATVTLWQQKRFRDDWRALSQVGHPGQPKIAPELRQHWTDVANQSHRRLPRNVAELQKLGIEAAKSTVEKYKPRGERLPSATWRTFLGQT